MEAIACLVDVAVFKTDEGAKVPWRVRFPSASAERHRGRTCGSDRRLLLLGDQLAASKGDSPQQSDKRGYLALRKHIEYRLVENACNVGREFIHDGAPLIRQRHKMGAPVAWVRQTPYKTVTLGTIDHPRNVAWALL